MQSSDDAAPPDGRASNNLVERRSVLVASAAAMVAAAVPVAASGQGSRNDAAKATVNRPRPAEEPQISGIAGQTEIAEVPIRADLRNEQSEQPIPFSRDSYEEAAFQRSVAALRTEGRLTIDGSGAGELDDTLRRIEAGFVFLAEAEDALFSSFHVEPLLDQAADLLDRGVRERATSDDLAERYLRALLELHEYAELDAIHREEEAGGLYDYQADLAIGEHRAALSEATGHLNVSRSIRTDLLATFFNVVTISDITFANAVLAWLSGVLVYRFDGQNFAGYVDHTVNGVVLPVREHAFTFATQVSRHALSVQRQSLLTDLIRLRFAQEAADNRAVGYAAARAFQDQNRNFQRRRTIVARRMHDIRARATTDPDGVLNLGKRLPAIRARFFRDFRDAVSRMKAAAVGLRDLFGYVEPLPPENTLDFFDNCLLWTRDALQWMVRFARRDQAMVLPISVRRVLGKNKWRDGKKKGFWRVTVPPAAFSSFSHVRLRGVSAAVESLTSTAFWHFEVVLPRTAVVQHSNGSTVQLDQSVIPPCRLGRVGLFTHPRDPEVVGTAALFNASPIGEWQVSTVADGLGSRNSKELDDIILFLHLAYQVPVR